MCWRSASRAAGRDPGAFAARWLRAAGARGQLKSREGLALSIFLAEIDIALPTDADTPFTDEQKAWALRAAQDEVIQAHLARQRYITDQDQRFIEGLSAEQQRTALAEFCARVRGGPAVVH